MLTHEAHGTYPIAPTPFHPDGSLDLASIDRLAAHYMACGADGVTVLGIMGEAPKLEPAESLAIVERFIPAMAGRNVIVGVSAPGFAGIRRLAHDAMARGAAGVMIAPAPHLRTDDEILAYFAAAARAVGPGIPWVLQDYPLTLTVVMTPGVIRRIVTDNPGCVMLKHEDWPGLEKITALRRFQAEGTLRPLSILTGNGGLFLDFEMERGADGAMTGYAFPEMLIQVVRRAKSGDRTGAHDLFDAHLPLLRYEQQARIGLAVRKYILMRRGLLGSDAQRAPAAPLTDTARAEVDFLCDRMRARTGEPMAARAA